MSWEKKGIVFVPDGKLEWSKTHAQVPVVDLVSNQVWRIYYATRDSENKSLISFIEVEAGNPKRILRKYERPILPFGRLGTFDEHGLMPSCILTVGKKKYLYYVGWSQRKSVPYQNSIGLAISHDGGITFQKYAEGPIIGVNDRDPFFTGTICVFKDQNIFRGYYLSCIEWRMVSGKPESLYVIKYAASLDGIVWTRRNDTCIPFKNNDEGGLVSATVVMNNDGTYYMWFGKRNYFDFRENLNNTYRIGFAESKDGIEWVRNDSKSGIDISESGWDSEMVSYPNVVRCMNDLFLFYNGNQFGKTGFGYAIWKS